MTRSSEAGYNLVMLMVLVTTFVTPPLLGRLARERRRITVGQVVRVVQGTDEPSDEQIGWFCQDADAVIGDHPDATEWVITDRFVALNGGG